MWLNKGPNMWLSRAVAHGHKKDKQARMEPKKAKTTYRSPVSGDEARLRDDNAVWRAQISDDGEGESTITIGDHWSRERPLARPGRECCLEWDGRCNVKLQPAHPTSTYRKPLRSYPHHQARGTPRHLHSGYDQV